MPANDAQFDSLVRAGKALLAETKLVSLQRWALSAGVPHGTIKSAYLDDPAQRQALEAALEARCVDAEGGCFLIR